MWTSTLLTLTDVDVQFAGAVAAHGLTVVQLALQAADLLLKLLLLKQQAHRSDGGHTWSGSRVMVDTPGQGQGVVRVKGHGGHTWSGSRGDGGHTWSGSRGSQGQGVVRARGHGRHTWSGSRGSQGQGVVRVKGSWWTHLVRVKGDGGHTCQGQGVMVDTPVRVKG